MERRRPAVLRSRRGEVIGSRRRLLRRPLCCSVPVNACFERFEAPGHHARHREERSNDGTVVTANPDVGCRQRFLFVAPRLGSVHGPFDVGNVRDDVCDGELDAVH